MELFTSVKSGKVSELIAQQIRNSILNGLMTPGDRLPPVRKLAEHFDVSHISVREALKHLEAERLIKIKPGSGVYVSETDSTAMTDSLYSILRINRLSLTELTEARITFEPSVARMAAERFTQDDSMKLQQNIEEAAALIQRKSSVHSKFIEFHSLIAEATHNPIIAITMKTLLKTAEIMVMETAADSSAQITSASNVLENHKVILSSLKSKDSHNAFANMLKDILFIKDTFTKYNSSSE